MIDSKEIGRRLKESRLKLGLSQSELAEKLDISPSTIAMYEIGERIPRDETKLRLAKIFQESVQSIFFEM
ncbi:MAG: helix-turn-helix transcriptional regulator [Coprobacillus sp.]|nr:helix-turn-helix transcriptional regulator [Coprobacillus sp.]